MILHVLYAELDRTLARVANFLSDPMRPIEPTLRAMIMTAPHIGERSKAILAKIGLKKTRSIVWWPRRSCVRSRPSDAAGGTPRPVARRASRKSTRKKQNVPALTVPPLLSHCRKQNRPLSAAPLNDSRPGITGPEPPANGPYRRATRPRPGDPDPLADYIEALCCRHSAV
jgi:hypothetical protein